nr:MAG TPA: restriction endonuclease [Caudoviricetes sp.]
MKTCTKCGECKPLSEFHRDSRKSSGYRASCASCCRAAHAAWYRTPHGQEVTKDYNASDRGKTLRNQATDRYRETENGKEVRRVIKARYDASEKGKIVKSKTLSAYKERNPIKSAARYKANKAVERGVISKPDSCESCGKHVRLEGHHYDYNLPLSVKWLCRKCHNDWHKENGPGLNGD